MSKMLLHELHPSLVHAPLALLPTATVADLLALGTGDRAWEKVGRRLWVAGTTSALFAGLAGLAASQEVRAQSPAVRDMMFLHGAGNALISLGALGVTLWRLGHRPTLAQCAVAVGAVGAAVYTASLGGKMVYEHGVGINAMPEEAAQGTRKGPPLLSREAPAALLRDAAAGLRWVLARAGGLLNRKQPLHPGARGFGAVHAREPAPVAIPVEGMAVPAEPELRH
jgi:uncharacterized membrane protein